MAESILRRRQSFAGLLPRYRRGLWLHVTWLWWSWDYLPAPIAERVAAMLDAMQAGWRDADRGSR